jgi:lysophospholipid acyltransferase (LPLAT)-like uncharacterized protein
MTSEELRFRLASGLGATLLGGLFATLRFTTEGEAGYRGERDAGRPLIFILWHGRLLPLSYFHRSWNLVTLISPSDDGEYITRIVQRWGYDVVRGSSSREGGPALRQLVRLARAGRSIAITPDGPRGPRETVKPGVLTAARLAGCALLPVGAAASRSWWFEGWDRFLVPKPLARVHIVYGQPIPVPRETTEESLRHLTNQAEADLKRVTAMADAHVAC